MVDYNKYFEYKDGKLYNKFNRSANSRQGEEAGYKGGRYHRVFLGGKLLSTHRVVWEIFNGAIPEGMHIDHIDHDTFNNKIENLRLVTPQDNCKNISKVTNLTWVASRQKWQAQLKVGGVNKWLGYFKDKELAELVVLEAREKYGFHQNHGK